MSGDDHGTTEGCWGEEGALGACDLSFCVGYFAVSGAAEEVDGHRCWRVVADADMIEVEQTGITVGEDTLVQWHTLSV